MKIPCHLTPKCFLLTAMFALGPGVNTLFAQTGPTLASSSPASGASNVPLDAPVIFTFSEAMQPTSDIFWGGVDSNLFTYAWSGDKKTLTCAHTVNFPPSTAVSWGLFTFVSESGDPMSIPAFGFFTTGASGGTTNDCNGPSSSGAFTTFNLFKAASYVQSGAGAPVPDSTDPFQFDASVNLATNRTATAATLTVPGGSPQSMLTFNNRQYLFFDSTNDLAKLNALYPAGNYTLAVTGSPSQSVVASLPSNAIPNAPHLNNYAAAQTINAASAFALNWDAFAGGTANDFILVEVSDSASRVVFQVENAQGCPSSLPGTATSVGIPALTLQSNQTYTAQITFEKNIRFDTNTYPGSIVFVAGQSTTQLTLSTGSGSVPPPAPVFTNVTLSVNSQINLQLQTQAGHVYIIEYKSDLGTPGGWTPLLSSNAVGSLIQVSDVISAGPGSRFYRARAN